MKVNNISIATSTKVKFKNDRLVTSAKPKENAVKDKKQKVGAVLIMSTAAATVGYIAYVVNKKCRINKVNEPIVENAKEQVSKYILDLAQGLGIYLKKPVKPESLSSVVTQEELLSLLKGLKKENYVATEENIKNGIFRADLHSHSVFSDGKASVEKILEEVASYADELYKKTGEKFIYALTDHDTAEGVKLALKIISEAPEKFKNVKFVIGSEVSFLIKSDKTSNPLETIEILMYGFNPFAKEVETFFSNIKTKRTNLVTQYIEDLSKMFPQTKFSVEEFRNVFLSKRPNIDNMANSHWLLYHYGQVKNVVSDTAKYKKVNPEIYFNEIISNSPERINLYELKQKGLIESWINENEAIRSINDKYMPKINKNGEFISMNENLLEEIAKAFKNEKGMSVGLAHPYFITERNSNYESIIKEIQSKLGEKLKFTESYHQAYPKSVIETSSANIERVNNFCEKENLIPIGGRDNHRPKWLK